MRPFVDALCAHVRESRPDFAVTAAGPAPYAGADLDIWLNFRRNAETTPVAQAELYIYGNPGPAVRIENLACMKASLQDKSALDAVAQALLSALPGMGFDSIEVVADGEAADSFAAYPFEVANFPAFQATLDEQFKRVAVMLPSPRQRCAVGAFGAMAMRCDAQSVMPYLAGLGQYRVRCATGQVLPLRHCVMNNMTWAGSLRVRS